jgi:hypothetical protein
LFFKGDSLLLNSSSQCQACSWQQRSCNMRSCQCICMLALAAPIRIVEDSWRRAFGSTGGVATQAGPLPPLTITSGKHCPHHKQVNHTCQHRPVACVLQHISAHS